MSQQVSCFDGVITVGIDGRANAQELYQGMRASLDAQTKPTTIVLDLTLATGFDQQVKSIVYRVLQHHHVGAIGICGVNLELTRDINDLATVLRRNRQVTISETELDLRAALGLDAALPKTKKLTGLLNYVKKA